MLCVDVEIRRILGFVVSTSNILFYSRLDTFLTCRLIEGFQLISGLKCLKSDAFFMDRTVSLGPTAVANLAESEMYLAPKLLH
jgi:hypothetical protein